MLPLLTHIIALFTWVIGPIIILFASEDKTTKEHARVALNWQISLTIYMVIASILIIVLIGIFLVPALALLNLVFCIIAAIKANEGKLWKYPLSIQFLK